MLFTTDRSRPPLPRPAPTRATARRAGRRRALAVATSRHERLLLAPAAALLLLRFTGWVLLVAGATVAGLAQMAWLLCRWSALAVLLLIVDRPGDHGGGFDLPLLHAARRP